MPKVNNITEALDAINDGVEKIDLSKEYRSLDKIGYNGAQS